VIAIFVWNSAHSGLAQVERSAEKHQGFGTALAQPYEGGGRGDCQGILARDYFLQLAINIS
jgi:hypothetical protein